jgi:hypothetical protein
MYTSERQFEYTEATTENYTRMAEVSAGTDIAANLESSLTNALGIIINGFKGTLNLGALLGPYHIPDIIIIPIQTLVYVVFGFDLVQILRTKYI